MSEAARHELNEQVEDYTTREESRERYEDGMYEVTATATATASETALQRLGEEHFGLTRSSASREATTPTSAGSSRADETTDDPDEVEPYLERVRWAGQLWDSENVQIHDAGPPIGTYYVGEL